jgi:glycosyltransferase involved in cell wall biosynthesis
MGENNVPERMILFIPMYNCERQIVRVLMKLEELQQHFEEVLIVNNRSTDNGEAAAIRALEIGLKGCKVTVLLNKQNYGLGGSHKVAFKYAKRNNYDFCLVLHGDDQGNINDILPELNMGQHRSYDCLLNSRFMSGSQRVGYSRIRTLGNLVFNQLFSAATGRRQYDLGSGLCCYSKKFLYSSVTEMCSDDLTFNYTLQLHASAKNVSQKFFPSSWIEDDQVSNVKLFRQTFQMVKLLCSFVFNRKNYLANSAGNPAFAYEADIVFQRGVEK